MGDCHSFQGTLTDVLIPIDVPNSLPNKVDPANRSAPLPADNKISSTEFKSEIASKNVFYIPKIQKQIIWVIYARKYQCEE